MAARYRKQNGFTMIEAMLAVMVLAVAATGVIVPFATGASVQAEAAHRSLGAKLASDLIERVTSDDFDTISATWTGYSEAEGAVTNAGGEVFSDIMYSRFSRYVTIDNDILSNVDHLLITVQTYYDGKQMAKLSKLIVP